MSLDGLRAWIGEVERKLGMRTRVFLALTTIAIGIGGAAIYLAIDARESSVSESDVRALQEDLETRIDEVAAAEPAPAGASAKPEGEPSGGGKEGNPTGAGIGNGTTDSGTPGTGGGTPGGAGGGGTSGGATGDGTAGGAAAKLQELVERERERLEGAK